MSDNTTTEWTDDSAWIDKQGDVWRLGADGLMHTPETRRSPASTSKRSGVRSNPSARRPPAARSTDAPTTPTRCPPPPDQRHQDARSA